MSEKYVVPAEQVESQQVYEESTETQSRKDLKPTIVAINVCCCFCCLLFLLLFFLIPRNPVGYLESTTLYLTTPLQVVQQYKVWNPSFYPVILDNFQNMNVKSDVIILNGTYQFTAQGELYNENHVHIPIRGIRYLYVSYLANSTAADLAVLTDQCLTSEGINFYTNGHFDYTTSLSPGYTYQSDIGLETNYVCTIP